MGRRMLGISPELLVGLCKRHDRADRTYSVTNPIPDDARIVGARVTPAGIMEVVLESREWSAQKHPQPEHVSPAPSFTVRYLAAEVVSETDECREGAPL